MERNKITGLSIFVLSLCWLKVMYYANNLFELISALVFMIAMICLSVMFWRTEE